VSSFGNGMKVSNYATTSSPATLAKKQQIQVYPNPAKDMVSISLPALNAGAFLEVYTISGQLVTSTCPDNTKNVLLKTGSFIPGIYVVRYGDLSARFIKE
jgi:Secretion system C-terminal sorting domain